MSEAQTAAAGDAAEVTPDAIMQLGIGVLGLEDAAERRRARGLLGAGGRGRARWRGAARALGPAPAERDGLLRRAGRAGHARARGRPLRQHAGDRAVPRPGQALLRRRDPGDGERPALRVLGVADRGPADRRPAKRGEGRRGLLRGALRRPGAARAVRARDERRQRRRGAGDRGQVSLAGSRQRDRHRLRRGRRAGSDRPGARAHHRRRVRPARDRSRSSMPTSLASGSASA